MKTPMRFRVWEGYGGQWYWEISNPYGRRLAASTGFYHTRHAAEVEAKSWIESHNGTTDDFE